LTYSTPTPVATSTALSHSDRCRLSSAIAVRSLHIRKALKNRLLQESESARTAARTAPCSTKTKPSLCCPHTLPRCASISRLLAHSHTSIARIRGSDALQSARAGRRRTNTCGGTVEALPQRSRRAGEHVPQLPANECTRSSGPTNDSTTRPRCKEAVQRGRRGSSLLASRRAPAHTSPSAPVDAASSHIGDFDRRLARVVEQDRQLRHRARGCA